MSKKVFEHLRKSHLARAAFHQTLAEAHAAHADGEQREFHKAAAKLHTAAGARAVELADEAEECMKAADSDFEKRFDELRPTGVSGITPDVPGRARIVPRFGQQAIADTPPVEKTFEKILAMPDADE
jgi:hypothetical protein